MENAKDIPGSSKEPKKNKKSTFLSADDYNLTEKDLEKARNELNETEERERTASRN